MEKITLPDALAHLGQGLPFKERLKIIGKPDYTTPAELSFLLAMIDAMDGQVRQIEKMHTDLLGAGTFVTKEK